MAKKEKPPYAFQRTEPKDPKKVIEKEPHLNAVNANGSPEKPKGIIASPRVREVPKMECMLTKVYQNALNEWKEEMEVGQTEYAADRLKLFLMESKTNKNAS